LHLLYALPNIAAASGFPAPKLALNCIGGSSAAAIAKVLQAGGTHVTYGAMSMQPLAPPTALLIFKDITFKGFWISGG
jgi:trans-2-enoyl-CoA reductase